MPIKIDCPRCKMPLAVPSKKLGSYVNCPSCGGRFWVAADAVGETLQSGEVPVAVPPTDASSEEAVVRPLPPTVAPTASLSNPPPADGTISMRNRPSTAPAAGSAAAPPPASSPATPTNDTSPPLPPVAHPAKRAAKAARFITAEAAQSTLKLADDGKLPELHLEEGRRPESKQKKSSSMNPLVLFGVLLMSVVTSILLVVVDTEPPRAGVTAKRDARRAIQDDYFVSYGGQPLRVYQQHLREAQRAYSRGDYKNERRSYRRVMELLRGERRTFEKGLTGSRQRDRELERLISILLREK